TILKIQELTKKYGSQLALDKVSLTIQRGDIYGLIGRNGAGKTTILKSIIQMIRPTHGTIQLFGAMNQDQHSYLKQLQRVGSIIEMPTAYEQLTAEQNLEYFCKLQGIVDKNAVSEALKFVGLEDVGKKKYKGFSLGMKQKLGLA